VCLKVSGRRSYQEKSNKKYRGRDCVWGEKTLSGLDGELEQEGRTEESWRRSGCFRGGEANHGL